MVQTCNGIIDCVDGSDEDERVCRKYEVHRCSYTFIWLYFIFILNHKCFSHPCCLCLISSEKEHCGSQFFTCANYQCIPFGKHCDRTLDCLDGSDEKDCGCDKDLEFQCQNKQCINKKYRCDMEGDCDDNSDEVGCSKFLLCENINLYFSQFFVFSYFMSILECSVDYNEYGKSNLRI